MSKEKVKFYYIKTNIQGITLVALVVTIIVLLILAGITITILFSDDGIIKKAQDAADATNGAVEDELQGVNNLADKMNNILNQINSDETIEIAEGLEIGSYVSYNPSGTYKWQAKYCSNLLTETDDDVNLNSASGQDFNISTWRVFSIDESTGKVQLIPTTQTNGTVYLGEAQGYNNGVKLLNDACNSLYGNEEKGIEARNINIEDIEKYMTDTALTEVYKYGTGATYGNQVSTPYSENNSNYPVIYSQEKLAVINTTSNGDTGLDVSEQNNFIERTDGTSGAIETATSIQPYQTYWYADSTFALTAFKDYTKKDGTTENYYNLIMPKGTSTTYWMSSRAVVTDLALCCFRIHGVYAGSMDSYYMYYSDGSTVRQTSRPLFPIVTVNSGIIEGNSESGFSIK